MYTKRQIFKAAHKDAKKVHVAGDCYAVTFAQALRNCYAFIEFKKEEQAANRAIAARHLTVWQRGNMTRAYAANETSMLMAMQEHGITCKAAYIDFGNGGNVVIEGLRAYGSATLAKKMGVRGVVKFEGSDADMMKAAIAAFKAYAFK